jgi:hypothetical protein
MHCQGYQQGKTTAVWGNWKADREAKWAALTRGQTSASLTAALFPCPLSKWDPWYTSQEQAWFENEGRSFLPGGCHHQSMAVLQFHSCLLPHLSSTSMKELNQGRQLSRPPWPSIFMSPSSPT